MRGSCRIAFCLGPRCAHATRGLRCRVQTAWEGLPTPIWTLVRACR
jgi:hypothetical protein